MKNNLKEIKEGVGLGELRFGMERDEVEKLLGTPNAVDEFVYENDDEIEVWHYDKYELSLSFNEEDEWRLFTIAVTADYYSFHNENLVGKVITKVKESLSKMKIEDLEMEDYSTIEDPNHFLLRSDAMGINFWFDNDVLTEIQWNPLLDDEDCIIWPEAK